jgi:hypothetical protein
MAPAHLTRQHFHRQAIAKVRSTNQHFINAPLSLRASKKDPNSTNQRSVRHQSAVKVYCEHSSLTLVHRRFRFKIDARFLAICSHAQALAQQPRCSTASLLELIECHQYMPSLAKEVADLASIVFNAYTSASPMWLQSSPVLILRCNRFGKIIRASAPLYMVDLSLALHSEH